MGKLQAVGQVFSASSYSMKLSISLTCHPGLLVFGIRPMYQDTEFQPTLIIIIIIIIIIMKTNSVALVRKRTVPAERPPLVGEVSANFS
jgi:hypothetical protein